MAKNSGKVREKSGNFVSPEKWEPWYGFNFGVAAYVLLYSHKLCTE